MSAALGMQALLRAARLGSAHCTHCQALVLALKHLQGAEPRSQVALGSQVATRSFASQGVGAGEEVSEEDVASLRRKVLVQRLLYRSKQRGFLELDLLVGLWARDHVPHMEEPELLAFHQVLEQENPDLFKWLTGQEEPPDHLSGNKPFQELRASVLRQLSNCQAPGARSAPGKPWVRGYEDWQKPAQSD